MSETQTEPETDAGPTPFASAPWEPERPDESGHAHVWGSDGDLVATVCDNPVYGETAYDRARFIAAAGTVAQEAREMGYDPVAAVEALPKLMEATESGGSMSDALCALKQAADFIEHETDSKLGAGRLHRLADEAAESVGLEIKVASDSAEGSTDE